MIEAKDTVMKGKQLDEFAVTWAIGDKDDVLLNESVLEAQAEISFKAGQEDVILESKMGTLTVSSLLNKGRREVVEWIKENAYNKSPMMIKTLEWQAKLKEWGIS